MKLIDQIVKHKIELRDIFIFVALIVITIGSVPYQTKQVNDFYDFDLSSCTNVPGDVLDCTPDDSTEIAFYNCTVSFKAADNTYSFYEEIANLSYDTLTKGSIVNVRYLNANPSRATADSPAIRWFGLFAVAVNYFALIYYLIAVIKIIKNFNATRSTHA